MKPLNQTLCTVLVLTIAGAAHAQTVINLDVQPDGVNYNPYGPQKTYEGLGAAPDDAANDFWNVLAMDQTGGTKDSAVDLVASDGTTATGISVAFMDAGVNSLKSWTNVGGDYNSSSTNAAHHMMVDFATLDWVGGGGRKIGISGLTGSTYDLYLYGNGTNFVGPNENSATFTVGDVSKSTSLADPATTSLVEGEDYVLFSNLVPTEGVIVFTFAKGPEGDGNGAWNGLQLVEISGLTLTGDANGDGQVDGNDLIAVEENFGATGQGMTGDANGDGQVDGNDLIAVEENFGATNAGGAAVPEPASLALIGLGGLALLQRRTA